MKKTAVQWYADQAMKLEIKRQSGEISTEEMVNEQIKALNQANEMFKEQMIGFAKNFEHIDIDKSDMENELNCYINLEDTEELLKETFKSE